MCNHRASSPLARGRAGAGGPSCLPPGAQPIQGHVLALGSSTFSSSSPQSLFPGRRAQSLPGSPTAVRALWRASGSFLNLLFSFAGALWSWRGCGHCRAGPSRPPRAPGTLSLLCHIPGVPRGVPCPAWWDVPPCTPSRFTRPHCGFSLPSQPGPTAQVPFFCAPRAGAIDCVSSEPAVCTRGR